MSTHRTSPKTAPGGSTAVTSRRGNVPPVATTSKSKRLLKRLTGRSGQSDGGGSVDGTGGGGSDPVTLDGAVLRVNPNTGAGMAGNPFFSSTDADARRIIAYGLRNPFRMTFRPGTNELWVGDVGWNTWEELNKIPNATDSTFENFGWPVTKGAPRNPAMTAPTSASARRSMARRPER